MISVSTTMGISPVNVMTSDNGGLSDEQIAQMAVDKIVAVSDNAPDVIRDQAHVFKENVKKTFVSLSNLGKARGTCYNSSYYKKFRP